MCLLLVHDAGKSDAQLPRDGRHSILKLNFIVVGSVSSYACEAVLPTRHNMSISCKPPTTHILYQSSISTGSACISGSVATDICNNCPGGWKTRLLPMCHSESGNAAGQVSQMNGTDALAQPAIYDGFPPNVCRRLCGRQSGCC